MNTIIQNILVLITLVLAIAFLVNKHFFKKQKSEKPCGTDDCNCH